jgi:hypothetical protein
MDQWHLPLRMKDLVGVNQDTHDSFQNQLTVAIMTTAAEQVMKSLNWHRSSPVEEEDEEEDEIAYFTPDGRLSSSPAKHQSPVFATSDNENTRHYSHSQISLLSVPSIGNQPHGRSRRESESSHSRQSLQEHEYMDMEEALDNLANTFRNVDLEVLREMLEEADGDYQVAAARCKKAIFEGRL